eukprot:s4229_g8.t1
MADDSQQPEVSQLELSTLDAEEMARVELLLNQASPKEKSGKRSAMQDYTAFALYLPVFIWEMYSGGADSLQVLEAIVKWLAEKFLLRCPSEPTSTCFAAWTIMRDSKEKQQQELRTPDVLLATTKAQVSAVLERYKVLKVAEDKYIKKLPLNPASLPEHVRKHAELCVAPRVKLSELLMLARQIPMRPRDKSKRLAVSKEASDGAHALNALSQFLGVAQMLREVQQYQPDNVNLQILQPKGQAPAALQVGFPKHSLPSSLSLMLQEIKVQLQRRLHCTCLLLQQLLLCL